MADQTTVTTQDPWGFLLPYMTQYMGGITSALQNNPPQPYGGPTVAPWSQNQLTAADMMRTFAMQGTPAYNASTGAIGSMAGGSANPYATGTNAYQPLDNPYLEQMVGSSNADITRNWTQGMAAPLRSSLAAEGAYGGSGYGQLMSQAGGDLAKQLAANEANLRGGAYNLSAQLAENQLNRATGAYDTEQARRLSAAGLGLQSQGTDLAAIQGLYGMGAQQQGQSQGVLDAMKQYWQGTQNAPYAASDILGNAISRMMGGGGTTTQTVNGPGTSPLAYLSVLPFLGSIFKW